LNRDGRLKLASLGQAEGAPQSAQRNEQLKTLWELNMPDLHLAIPHLPGNRTKWIKSFMGLQPGQYFFLTVLAQLDISEPDDYLVKLLSAFNPAGVTGDAAKSHS
jgi:hypothetical protein